jgi:MutS domain V
MTSSRLSSAPPAAILTAATPREIYRQRLAARSGQLSNLDTRRHRCGLLRLIVFVLAATAVWFAIQGKLPLWPTALPVAIFVALVWWQSRIEREMECARRAIAFYERGIARIEHRWQGGGETGERFIDPHHPYSLDLDIFGRGSLFELLSTARTRGGEAKLADWLREGAAPAELRQRHQAIEELRPSLDLREQLAVLGSDFRVGVNPEHLSQWAIAPVNVFAPSLRWGAFILSILMAGALLWWFATSFIGIEATRVVVAIGAVAGAMGLSLRKRVLEIAAGIHEPAHDLELLAQILALLERQSFTSARLATLSAAIRTGSGHAASGRIGRLRRWMELMDSRDNFFVRIIGPPLLWTTQLAMAIEAWRAENGALIPGWLDAVAEIETLSSLANYAFEHPRDVFPELMEGEAPFDVPMFDVEDVAHPLLPDERAVCNSVRLSAPVRLLVVSGSNMSGKSTLLRAVGANAVLALAGGPVRARRLTLTRLSVGASIRTTDSLEEGQSRFMAEILRLKQILELPAPAFFLLDELLHGTNSHDRAIGAEGIVRALLARGAIGLATTHDLSLAAVAGQLAPAAANVHFEDRLENGRLVFDYRMRAGVVTRSNALDLMRAAGLDV